ncbi:MAG: carbon-nitrogen family hydrolase [Oscillospiraceae bacterium]|nr:carbon-nitrogen family hydrolase [Oscillospiraceae bacterium]MBR2897503.1 carbon-nitrogen family hydrolase [Oscillospiraceae bacterium]
MKISCIQMDMRFSAPEENFAKAERLIAGAAADGCDVIVLPETWNTGFFPKEDLAALADNDGEQVRARIGALAKKLHVNIVAGSVANKKEDGVYNTAYVFDREGKVAASYDKTHLFTPMGEHDYFRKGDHLAAFTLDGVRCGIIICYDVRFPELTRTYAVDGMDVLFVVSQWPSVRIPHLLALTKARAIENQAFVVCCNSCGQAGETVYGGNSSIHDPWGETLTLAGAKEETITADCDLSVLKNIRETINVFRDRRPELYNVNK